MRKFKELDCWSKLGYLALAGGITLLFFFVGLAAFASWQGYDRYQKSAEHRLVVDKAQDELRAARYEFEARALREALDK